jgi:hypothetical protein
MRARMRAFSPVRIAALRQSLFPVNISRLEQRVLHCLAQGGRIQHLWNGNRIVDVDCFSRDGYRLTDCTLDLFKRLKKRGLIASQGGGPYRISRLGLTSVRAQLDNR